MKGKEKGLRYSRHCQRSLILPKDSFWNMKGTQACRPRAVYLALMPCLRFKMGTGRICTDQAC